MSVAQQVGTWAGRFGLQRKAAIALAIAAVASGIATYLALTGAPPFGPRPVVVLSLLNLDLVLLLALAALVVKRLVEVWASRRRGLAGSRLQVRLVVLFSLIAVLPTIIVAVFSYLFFSFGIESWFSDKVRTAISESVEVADAYVKEHQQAIRADALAMANDLNHSAPALQLNPQYLAPILTAQAAMRSLTEAAVTFHLPGHCRCAANRLKLRSQAPVAQLDRALPSEGKGHTFESCRVRQLSTYPIVAIHQIVYVN